MEYQNNEVTDPIEYEPFVIEMRGFYETAYLLAEGGILVRSWKDETDPEGKRKIFLIQPPEDYKQKLKDYRNGIAVTNITVFLDKVHALRKVIFADPT